MTNNVIIKSFSIKKLHGYKDISIEMNSRTGIFVSENGVGKTIILNNLYNILKLNFFHIHELDFEFMELEINNDKFKFTKNDFEKFISFRPDTTLSVLRYYSYYENPQLLFDVLNYKKGNMLEDKTFNMIYANSDEYRKKFIDFEYAYLDTIKKIKESLNFDLARYAVKYKDYLDSFDILYLPTYRRIEKLPSRISEKVNLALLDQGSNTNQYEHFAYGLKDVEESLKNITIEIERESSSAYRALSADMLTDLLNTRLIIAKDIRIPKIEDLTIFLNRVNKNDRNKNKLIRDLGRFYTAYYNKKIDDRYASESTLDKDDTYLLYFLSKLNEIINKTKVRESKVDKFVSICNKYLESAGDSKVLKIDEVNYGVCVYDNFLEKEISFDCLSSGEKQIIALISMVYLNDKKRKIILIDEPELSLSIKWQRMILIDISSELTTEQLIAITHSPFVFDNELESHANSVNVKRVRKEKK
ncbi:AAA family ATPase [Providencia sp. PROV174]|uniref:AAA family ATPase n=1 Tax=Providencia sp. PROV174 TaxID=2949877 RepID=UPI00234BF18F|nr:AAA family ATPase [Providencia sp. PROV174]